MRYLDLLQELHRDDSGQDLLEYALVLAAVAAAAVAGSTSLANTITSALNKLNSKISGYVS